MSIQATCPNCQATYNLRDEVRGKTVRCKKCEKPFVAGGAIKGKAEDDEPEKAPRPPGHVQARPAAGPPIKSRPADARKPRRRDEDDDDDDEGDDYARPRKKSSALTYVLIGGGAGALVLVLACCGVGVLLMRAGDDDDGGGGGGGGGLVGGGGMAGGGAPNRPPADANEALTLLKNNDVFRRGAALDWLAQAPVDDNRRAEVIGALEPLVTGGDGGAADQAAKAFAHWATAQQVPTLLTMLNSRSPGVRAVAMEALGRFKDERAIGPLAGRLPDFFDRAAAGRPLEAIGAPAEKEVLKYAFHKDGGCRDEARRLLKVYGTKDGDFLSQALLALKSPENDSRHAAAEWLGGAAVDPQRGPEVTQALEPLLDDSHVFNRDPAAKALCRWATRDDKRGAAALARHLTDPFNSGMYGKALETIGPAAEGEVLKYFFDPNNAAQQEARRLARVFGTKQDVLVAQAVADLKDAAADDKRLVPVCAWLGLAQADDKSRPDVSRALDPLVKSSNRQVHEEAVKALAVWGTKDNVESLLTLVQNGDFGAGGTRKLAIQALGTIKDDRAAPAVAARLPDFFDRETAAAALENMGPGAEKAVLPYVGHNDAAVRVLACRVLKSVGGKDSLKALEIHAKADQSAEARAAAAMAYTAIKGRQ